MHDLAAIRRDPDGFDRALARRGLPGAAQAVLAHDERRRNALTELQTKQERRKALSREVGAGRREGRDAAPLETEATRLRDELPALERQASDAEAATRAALEVLPNILDADVPDGADEGANVVVHQRGEPLLRTGAKQHFELGEALGGMDFEAAAKIAGSRFVVLRGTLARLERMLGQFMLDLHVAEHGYTEVMVPLLVNDAAAYGTDKLPKFAEDLFRTTDGRWLIPTAEVPLTALAMDVVLPADRLPLRYAALSDCFRSEAGSAGRDTRGMLRQHQFRKCELVSVVAPEDSAAEQERMTRCAETVLERLELPYRRVLLCAGDTGFGAVKTYDLEVWLPGQQAWREISSCSNTRAFQARRMNARYRPAAGGKVDWVHTLNGSGTAVGRAMIAVMENGQQQDGSIALPPVLQPLMGGTEIIPPPG